MAAARDRKNPGASPGCHQSSWRPMSTAIREPAIPISVVPRNPMDDLPGTNSLAHMPTIHPMNTRTMTRNLVRSEVWLANDFFAHEKRARQYYRARLGSSRTETAMWLRRMRTRKSENSQSINVFEEGRSTIAETVPAPISGTVARVGPGPGTSQEREAQDESQEDAHDRCAPPPRPSHSGVATQAGSMVARPISVLLDRRGSETPGRRGKSIRL